MLTYDQQWGSRPHRSHNLGFFPWNEANKVPTLSHWWHDVVPMYACCLWQEEQAVGCETFRFERRPSQDCIAYQSPGVATLFGDPHFVTFDGVEYTFNGKGEFVLLRVNDLRDKLDVQGRFEQMPNNIHGQVMATQLTSIAGKLLAVLLHENFLTEQLSWLPDLSYALMQLLVFSPGGKFSRVSLKVLFQ